MNTGVCVCVPYAQYRISLYRLQLYYLRVSRYGFSLYLSLGVVKVKRIRIVYDSSL